MSNVRVKLKDVATFVNGRAFKPTEWTDIGTPIIRIQNLTDENCKFNYYAGTCDERYLVSNGDILISWSATLGVFEWNRGKAWLNQHIFKVVFDKMEIDKNFFKFLIRSKIEEMMSFAHGSTMKHITKSDFDEIEIELPPLERQKEIANSFLKTELIINARKRTTKLLHKLINSTFVEMFGHPELNEKGWPVVSIDELCVIGSQIIDPKKEEYRHFYNIGSANIESKTGKLINLKTVADDNAISVKFLVNHNHVIYSKIRPKLEKVALVPEGEYICSADIYPLQPRTGVAERYFLKYFLLNDQFTEKASLIAESRSNIPKMNREELSAMKAYRPPYELQNKFAKIVQKIEKNILLNHDSERVIEELNK